MTSHRFRSRASAIAWLWLATACGRDDTSQSCRDDPACAPDAEVPHYDPVEPGKTPPPDPGGPQAQGTAPTVLAVRRLFLGETTWEGEKDFDAWQLHGYNLDGVVSTSEGSNHCALVPGAPKLNTVDGERGVDNKFGEVLLHALRLFGDTTAETNATIGAGEYTLLISLPNLDPVATQSGVEAWLFEGAQLGAPPLWDGTDAWPIAAASVNRGNAGLLQAGSSYVADGTFVSAPPIERLPLRLRSREDVFLEILGATVTLELSGSGPSATGARGVIAGVLDVQTVLAETRRYAGAVDPDWCASNTLDSFQHGIEQMAEIMLDHSNGDPSLACNAISIGIGFEASAVTLGDVAPFAPPPPPPGCPP